MRIDHLEIPLASRLEDPGDDLVGHHRTADVIKAVGRRRRQAQKNPGAGGKRPVDVDQAEVIGDKLVAIGPVDGFGVVCAKHHIDEIGIHLAGNANALGVPKRHGARF